MFLGVRLGIILAKIGISVIQTDRMKIIVKPVITYTPIQWRGSKPRQRRWGSFSLANCKHIFGIYYNNLIG